MKKYKNKRITVKGRSVTVPNGDKNIQIRKITDVAAQESIELKGTIAVQKEKKKKKILLETKEKKTFVFANPKQFRKVEKFKGREIKITCYLAGGKTDRLQNGHLHDPLHR